MSPEELLDLSQRLSQEKLYTQTERESIARLNQDVSVAAAQVCKTAWLVKQQRTNLSRLKQDDASLCCLKANILGTTNFVDAFHHLNYHESKFSSFLKMLRDEPALVAEFIASYSSTVHISETIDILIGALYGSCVSPHEEVLVATMLRKLTAVLMSNPSNTADRVLTKDKCAWCQVYRAYTDCLPSCKIFLASALHQPIINLLTMDDWFYDIEPSKVLERFPPLQRQAKFGNPSTESYATKTKEYRQTIAKQLHTFAMDFINHIKDAMMCFPAPLQWLVAHVNSILIDTGRYDEVQSRSICTELVFDLFICPAVIDPMLYGLTSDVPVSHIARHNLIQVARILQVLSKGQRSEEKLRVPNLYSLFEEDCLVELMNGILQNEPSQTLRLQTINVFSRSAVFIGTQQLNTLVLAFRETVTSQLEDSDLRQRGEAIVKSLPNLQQNTGTEKESHVLTPSHSPQVKSKRPKTKTKASDLTNTQASIPPFSAQEVISITVDDVSPVGLIEEEKVLSSIAESRETTSRLDGSMKKTRFYLAQDQESIGNVSEYQASELADAISEAASVRSERSTNLDDGEDVDDNLSDMVSANVSGRGSPNISGRETPQSMGEGGGAANPPNLPITVRKPNNDLTDRFGKFAIETSVDRAIDNRSLVSDSWSTDVYASDSEPPETQYEAVGPPLIPEMINETASESAWSTDVLNSDTSERPIDRLGELDQNDESLVGIDQGSESDAMSTRSTDSRRGEPSSPFIPVRHQVPQANQLFPFSGSAAHQPAFPDAAPSDARRADIGRLNHSSNSSFTTTLPLPGQYVQPSNYHMEGSMQLPNHMAPLQPIRTQGAAGHVNVLDMFDPLNEELPTPPIRQAAENTEWAAAGDVGTNSLPKAAWQPVDRQAQASDAVSNWSRGGASQQANPPWQPTDPWASNKPSQGAVWNNSTASSDWPSNQVEAAGTESASNVDGKQEDSWPSGQTEARQRNSKYSTGGPQRLGSSSSNRFAVIEDDTVDTNSRSSLWTTQNRNSVIVTNVSTAGQATNPLSVLSGGTVTSVATASGGAIPKRTMPRTNSQSSTNEEVDGTLITPGKKLGKEKKSMLNSFIKKGKRGRSSGKASPMRHLERQSDSPVISEPRDEVTSSASDDSGQLKRADVRRDSERSDKAESTEDILEKYRTSNNSKQAENLAIAASPCLGRHEETDEPSIAIYDPDNLEKCLAFADAKKKLRLVLSTPALYSISLMSMYRQLDHSTTVGRRDNFLVQYLQVLLSEALLHQDLQLVTQIQETVRCLQRFSNNGCRKLMRSIREEYQTRVHYISYLAKSRHKLLSMQARTHGMLLTLNRDKENCLNSLIQECVRVFLDKRDSVLKRFNADFSKLQSPDEKAAALERCLMYLCNELDRDEMWKGANEVMREEAQQAIERGVMERVYKLAMFPNGDGDTQRDKIYSENVDRLALTVTPNHRKLRIPSVYHLEAPWSSAQAHLMKINAFKTPGDKVQCVCQCVNTIMGLLRMAHTKSVPGADDFLPVFIYVLIMANPPNLLSSIQYVESLYETRMEGEEAYNWTQLNTAVAFIKMWLQESLMLDDKAV